MMNPQFAIALGFIGLFVLGIGMTGVVINWMPWSAIVAAVGGGLIGVMMIGLRRQ